MFFAKCCKMYTFDSYRRILIHENGGGGEIDEKHDKITYSMIFNLTPSGPTSEKHKTMVYY